MERRKKLLQSLLKEYEFLKANKYDENYWKSVSNSGEVNAWSGVAFERVCLEHIPQIKKALGISGVQTDVNSLRCGADSEKGLQGSQIDLLIVRKDQVINVCEMKYCESEFSPDLAFDKAMRRRISDLRIATKTKYAIHSLLFTAQMPFHNLLRQYVAIQVSCSMKDRTRTPFSAL